MIPKAQILDLSKQQDLRPTTIEKDYVLGWLLCAIAQHECLGRWIFKGGTCLKKCFFETYRFSEDLDFTIPEGEPLDTEVIMSGLVDVVQWVEDKVGIQFPRDGIEVETFKNTRGNDSFQAKATYAGPLDMPRHARQRVKFDLTKDEIVVDEVDYREVSHPYEDELEQTPKICCYSVNEILAEKTRALYERKGRARDIYDIVHLSRTFRQEIDVKKASEVLERKFAFRELPEPSVQGIIAQVDIETLRALDAQIVRPGLRYWGEMCPRQADCGVNACPYLFIRKLDTLRSAHAALSSASPRLIPSLTLSLHIEATHDSLGVNKMG